MPAAPAPSARPARPAAVVRWVDQRGQISLAGFAYKAGRVFAGEPVEVVCDVGLVELVSKGVVIATHAQVRRRDDPKPTAAPSRSGRVRAATSGTTVKRIADAGGSVSFAGAV